MAKVTMYTDGGASGNPGPGGYGTLLMYGEHVKEMSEGFRLTTNNRMELLAVIVGLEALTRDGVEVEVYSDSKYVVDAVMKRWVFNWEKKGTRTRRTPICGSGSFASTGSTRSRSIGSRATQAIL